jgi:predicted MFS family arabinose efflux permease
VVVVTASAVAGTLPVFLVGALAVQLRDELDFGPSQQGLLVSLFFGTVAVAALPLGQLADRLGWWQAIRTTALGIIAGLVVAATAQSWAMLAVALVGCALVHALGMPAGNLAIVRAIPVARRGLAFGIRQAAIPMSMLLGGLSVPVVAVWFGWRPVFVLALLVPLLVLVSLRRLRASPSAGRGAHSDGGRPPLTVPLVLMLGLSACGAFLVNTASAFLVSTAVAGGVDEAAAGILLMFGSLVALAVRVVVGMVVDRRGLRGFGLIAALLFVGTLGFVLVAAGGAVALVVGTALAFGFGTGWPGLMHYVITAEHPRHAGGVSGWVLACGNVGGFVGPVLFGIVVEQWSYSAGWMVLAVTAAIGGLLVLAAGHLFGQRVPLTAPGDTVTTMRT